MVVPNPNLKENGNHNIPFTMHLRIHLKYHPSILDTTVKSIFVVTTGLLENPHTCLHKRI